MSKITRELATHGMQSCEKVEVDRQLIADAATVIDTLEFTLELLTRKTMTVDRLLEHLKATRGY